MTGHRRASTRWMTCAAGVLLASAGALAAAIPAPAQPGPPGPVVPGPPPPAPPPAGAPFVPLIPGPETVGELAAIGDLMNMANSPEGLMGSLFPMPAAPPTPVRQMPMGPPPPPDPAFLPPQ